MAEWEQTIASVPLTGSKTTLAREGDSLYLHHQSNHEALLSENRDLSNQPQNRHARTRLAARIPPHLYYVTWPSQFKRMHGENPHRPRRKNRAAVREMWREFVRAKLNDKANAYLRVDGGKRL